MTTARQDHPGSGAPLPPVLPLSCIDTEVPLSTFLKFA